MTNLCLLVVIAFTLVGGEYHRVVAKSLNAFASSGPKQLDPAVQYRSRRSVYNWQDDNQDDITDGLKRNQGEGDGDHHKRLRPQEPTDFSQSRRSGGGQGSPKGLHPQEPFGDHLLAHKWGSDHRNGAHGQNHGSHALTGHHDGDSDSSLKLQTLETRRGNRRKQHREEHDDEDSNSQEQEHQKLGNDHRNAGDRQKHGSHILKGHHHGESDNSLKLQTLETRRGNRRQQHRQEHFDEDSNSREEEHPNAQNNQGKDSKEHRNDHKLEEEILFKKMKWGPDHRNAGDGRKHGPHTLKGHHDGDSNNSLKPQTLETRRENRRQQHREEHDADSNSREQDGDDLRDHRINYKDKCSNRPPTIPEHIWIALCTDYPINSRIIRGKKF